MSVVGPQLPVGTQVVFRVERLDTAGGTAQRGATGRVSGVTADGQYVVRLVDGREATAKPVLCWPKADWLSTSARTATACWR